MKTLRYVGCLFLLSSLISCVEKGSESIEVASLGKEAGISVSLNNSSVNNGQVVDLGEFTRGVSEAVDLDIKITNHSTSNIFNFRATILDPLVRAYDYAKTGNEPSSFPGEGGTCGSVIAARSSCLIKMRFSSSRSGQFRQSILFDYNNVVKADKFKLHFVTLSGLPASVIFDPDQTNFHFGNLVGAAQTPLVERSQPQLYSKILTIRNAGELTARSFTIGMEQTCVSKSSGLCPAGQETAYQFENINCGNILEPGQSCQVKMEFTPLNQGSAADQKEIKYTATIRADYKKDTEENSSALNGYFTTVSANIAARFESSLLSFNYPEAVVVGNRATLGFRAKNTGYRPGYLQKILVYNQADDDFLFYCQSNDTPYLQCYDADTDALTTVAEFPFIFKDREGCMNSSMTGEVENDSGCLFDILFQPSITKTVGGTEQYKMRFAYDTRWLGQEDLIPVDHESPTIAEEVNFDVTAEYKSAAKIEVSAFKFGSDPQIAPPLIGANLYQTDIGRIALQNPSFEVPKIVVITFANTGETKATNLSFKDGSNISIAIGEYTNLGGLDGGSQSPQYFRELFASTEQCEEIPAGGTCQIAFSFVPIGRSTEEESHQGMFDYYEGVKDPDNYKAFLSSYDNGSLYSDDNLTTTKNIADKSLELRVKAIILSKGILGDEKTVKFFAGTSLVAPEVDYKIIRYRNIGTGKIPYIVNRTTSCYGIAECPEVNGNATAILVKATDGTYGYNPADFGANYDCAELIDWDRTYTTGDDINFAMGESCTLKYVHRLTNDNRVGDIPLEFGETEVNEITRLFEKAPANSDEMWEYTNDYSADVGIRLTYYDFDIEASVPATDPAINAGDTNYLQGLGVDEDLDSYSAGRSFSSPAKIIPTTFSPTMIATMHRPAFTKSDLLDNVGALKYASIGIDEFWFNKADFATKIGEGRHADDNAYGNSYISKEHATTLVSGAYACADCEYTIHFGTFPMGKTSKMSFQLDLFAANSAVLNSVDFTADANFIVDSGTIAGDTTLTAAGPHLISLSLTPPASGVYQKFVEYTYETGVDQDITGISKTRTIKVQLLAEVIDDPPLLTFGYQNYELTLSSDPDTAPVETLVTNCDGSGNPCSLAPSDLGEAVVDGDTSNRVFLQMVKLANIETNTGYVKKRLIITNSSSTRTAENLSFDTQNSSGNFTGFETSGTCIGVTSLGPGASCYFEYKLQPTNFTTSGGFLLSPTYEFAPNQYYNQNIPLDYEALDPGSIVACNGDNTCNASNIALPNVRVAADGSTGPAFQLNMGTNIVMNQGVVTKNKIFTLGNTSNILRASFLKSWHEYLVEHDNTAEETTLGTEYNSGNTPPLSLHPPASIFSVYSSRNYTNIYQRNYPDGSPRIIIKASDGCFYGDNAYDDFEPNKRGFLGGSTDRCLLRATINLTINDVKKNVTSTSPYSDMKDSYFTLPFFSFERSNDGVVGFFFRYRTYPDSSLAVSTPEFTDVTAKNDKTISFTFPDLEADNSAVGDVSEYRIYYSDVKNVLTSSSLYINTSATDYLSTTYTDDGNSITVNASTANLSGLTTSKAYYFKVVAIRENSDYNAGYFQNLADGYYFSDTDLPILRVVVPPAGHHYIHEEQVFLKEDIELDSGSLVPTGFSDSKALCTGQTAAPYFDNSNTVAGKKYALMDDVIWEYIRADGDLSNYSTGYDPLELPHWLDSGAFSIDTVFAAQVGFNPEMDSQIFASDSTLYKRCEDSCSNDRMIGGGFYYTDAYDYISYAGESLPFAQARCILDVSP